MNKKHKIIKIVDLAAYSTKGTLMVAFWAKMDCPIMPQKIIISKKMPKVGQTLDPHFSNKDIVARFPATKRGWDMATFLLSRLFATIESKTLVCK